MQLFLGLCEAFGPALLAGVGFIWFYRNTLGQPNNDDGRNILGVLFVVSLAWACYSVFAGTSILEFKRGKAEKLFSVLKVTFVIATTGLCFLGGLLAGKRLFLPHLRGWLRMD